MDKLLEKYAHIGKKYDAWWNGKGSIVNILIVGDESEQEYDNENWKASSTDDEYYFNFHTNPKFNAIENRNRVRNTVFMGDTIPVAMIEYGAVSMAAYLGCKQSYREGSVWYTPFITDENKYDDILLCDDNEYWKFCIESLEANMKYSDEMFLGIPGLSPGIDTLYQMRGSEHILYDIMDDPLWVREKLAQIEESYYIVFDKLYEKSKREDGSMVFGYFSLWGKGRTTQVQCDVSALLSPEMFRDFELPLLEKRCWYCDNTLYHLDGTQAMVHLDALLEIESLKAIEWSPQAGIETGGDKRWYPLYEKILNSGKALQVVEATKEQTEELFKNFSGCGINVMSAPMSKKKAEDMLDKIEKYR